MLGPAALLLLATAAAAQDSCGADQYEAIRGSYEECANNKILRITSQLTTVQRQQEHEQVICDSVRDLIDNCGTILSNCFTLEQIEETKLKQKLGIEEILLKHFSEDTIEQCFQSNRTIEIAQMVPTITSEADFTPASTTIVDNISTTELNKIEEDKDDMSLTRTIDEDKKKENLSENASTKAVNSQFKTTDLDIGGDQATTPSSVLPIKCTESEYSETRENYERCASNKIREITAWLERRERRRRSSGSDSAAEERASILTVCSAVRQLLYDCGNELGWCFTEDQVSDTRYKQKAGLEDILSKYYSAESLKMCFVQQSISLLTEDTATSEKSAIGPKEPYRRPKQYSTSPQSSAGARAAADLGMITIVTFLYVKLFS